MRPRRRSKKTTLFKDNSRLAAIADAYAAAEAAARLAKESAEWSSHAGVGEDDAAEVTLAALRAREAATGATRARTREDAWEWARQAWAAVTSAKEADARVNAAVVESLMAA